MIHFIRFGHKARWMWKTMFERRCQKCMAVGR